MKQSTSSVKQQRSVDRLLAPKIEDPRVETIFEHPLLAYHEIDINGIIRWVNRRECELLGYQRSEMIGRPIWHFLSETGLNGSRATILQKLQEVRPVQVFERILERATGESVAVEIHETLIRDVGGNVLGMGSALLDLTDRRQAALLSQNYQQPLDTDTSSQRAPSRSPTCDLAGQLAARLRLTRSVQESEERYRESVLRPAPSAYRATPSGQFAWANLSMVEMLGYGSFQALAAASESCARQIWDRVEFGIQIRKTGELKNFVSTWHKADGTPLCIRENAHVIWDDNGEPKYFEGTVEDITERRQLEEQLRQAQKMEAIGRLAAGVAHDFNNVLMVISGYSRMLLDRLPECDPSREAVNEVSKAAGRGVALTKQLLSFSRLEPVRFETLDLNQLVSEMNSMLLRLIGENIQLSTRLQQDLNGINGDPGQIGQIIMNLAVNARDAMSTGGTLLIETFQVEIDAAAVNCHLGLKNGCYVVLALSDNGCGMDSVTRAKIFEPFFTTKEADQGTGVGLATVYAIVKQAKGKIEVESEPGIGSTFRIYFPAAVIAAACRTEPVKVPLALEKLPTILLVEDDEVVREFVQKSLHRLGYHVLEAEDGQRALYISETHRGQIDLLLTDVVMPGMQGPEVSARVTEQRPEIRTVFMSGYTDDKICRIEGANTASLIRKPFTIDQLSEIFQRSGCIANRVDALS